MRKRNPHSQYNENKHLIDSISDPLSHFSKNERETIKRREREMMREKVVNVVFLVFVCSITCGRRERTAEIGHNQSLCKSNKEIQTH
jgi:hypothetical protein